LILEAKKLGSHRTKQEAVTAALVEYIQRRRQLDLLTLFGKIEYFGGYNYKRARAKR
jgi:hypothetical protein